MTPTRRNMLRVAAAPLMVLAVLVSIPGHRAVADMNSAGAGTMSSLRGDASLHRMANGKIAFFGGYTDGSVDVINPDGSGLRGLVRCTTRSCGICDAVWSPDGKQIAFDRATNGRKVYSVYVSVYVMNANGSGERRVASWEQGYITCWGESLAWSPNGTSLAVARGGSLYVLDLKTGGMRRLTTRAADRPSPADHDPAWSPDGSRVAFARGGCGNVCPTLPYIVHADGRGLRRLSTFYGELDCGGVLWSPDGRTIAFCASKTHTLNKAIYAVNPDGSHLRLLVPAPPTGTNQQQTVVGWSPDGKHILYFTFPWPGSKGPHATALWVMNANGTGRHRLYRGYIEGATWSPDGQRIAFSGGNASRSGLFVMAADGRHLHRLVAAGGRLAWQPIP